MPVYTIFSQTGGGSDVDDAGTYTMGMQFTVSENASLTGIWFYSVFVGGSLPAGCAIFQETSPGNGTVVAGTNNASPTWSGAAGSGWVKCTYPGTTTLTPGTTYKVCVLLSAASSHQYSATSAYWSTGAGASGLTNGPLSAPNNAGGDGGQDTFLNPSGSIGYPTTSFSATNYWVDVEVTAAAPAGSAPAGSAGTVPVLIAAGAI